MRKLFIDLDGTLADFDSGYESLTGVHPRKHAEHLGDVDWKVIKAMPKFFYYLSPLPHAQTFFYNLRHFGFSPTVLTGCPKEMPDAAEQKRAWVAKWLGADVPVITCRSRDKCHHLVNAGDILVDDWERYRHLWEALGGHWITFKGDYVPIFDEIYDLFERDAKP